MNSKIHVLLKPICMDGYQRINYIINRDSIHFPEELNHLLELKKLSNTHGNIPIGKSDDTLTICLRETHMEDFGDYDYDDNYIPNYQEETTYIPIQYNPITGERFEIVVDGLIDMQKEYDEIYQEYCEIPNSAKRTKKQGKRFYQLNDILNSFYRDLYVSDEGYQQFLKKSINIPVKEFKEK